MVLTWSPILSFVWFRGLRTPGNIQITNNVLKTGIYQTAKFKILLHFVTSIFRRPGIFISKNRYSWPQKQLCYICFKKWRAAKIKRIESQIFMVRNFKSTSCNFLAMNVQAKERTNAKISSVTSTYIIITVLENKHIVKQLVDSFSIVSCISLWRHL